MVKITKKDVKLLRTVCETFFFAGRLDDARFNILIALAELINRIDPKGKTNESKN